MMMATSAYPSDFLMEVTGYLEHHEIGCTPIRWTDDWATLAFDRIVDRANAYLWLNHDGYRVRVVGDRRLVVRPELPY
jgi:hypothetical protein